MEDGKAPLKVNASAGKALNLISDRLDNFDSSAFLKAGQKAADSDKLDGIDPSGFYRSGSKVADSSHADQADNATNVANADTVDGKHAADFAAKAEVPGFDAQTGASPISLSLMAKDIATITVTAPADGFVILTGNGNFSTNHTNGTETSLSAYLTMTSGLPNSDNRTWQNVPPSAPSGFYDTPFSITRVFPVTAGEHTFYMTADVWSGSGRIGGGHSLTGVFVKNRL